MGDRIKRLLRQDQERKSKERTIK